ncbi:Glycosyltransferase involved in cell wall bisynthesis [Pseudomonas pohangensis]|uniref:Glycosyltransferase involved in cell wall bisynthesis n=1 Tax=Pseudomonas pohangensis TaxID=364197 RepID=A0A1H2HRJ3_9PSED|nr:glycosyltransferase [Pseudomonas pohangensis]SDU34435.1 Glycosyltransferase involved in cell wall bisynthesis [Pseudomonas pohangensis]
MSFADHPLIVVTPVYEDVEASSRLFMELAVQFAGRIFVVAVDDGSVKTSLDIDSLQRAGLEGVILQLRRNVGHQRAIAIGLGYVSERIESHQRVVVMDSDGEDLPATIPDLLQGLEQEQVDVVVAQRKSRIETLKFKLFYAIYKRFFSLMTGRAISFGNFMGLKANAVRRLVAMQELPIHVAGTVLASKLRTTARLIDRGPRYAGQSKMNFVGLVLHGFKGLMVFAEDVLVRVGILCGLIASFSMVGITAAIILKLVGFSTPGWFSVALGILVLMLLQTGALALMTLMLTGVVRGGTVSNAIAYHDFVERVIETRGQTSRP